MDAYGLDMSPVVPSRPSFSNFQTEAKRLPRDVLRTTSCKALLRGGFMPQTEDNNMIKSLICPNAFERRVTLYTP